RVTGRAGDDAGRGLVAVVRGPDRVADRLVDGLGEAVKLADVEIDPAHLVLGAAPGDQYDLGLDHAGVADEPAARLHNGLRDGIAKMPPQRAEDGFAVGFELRSLAHIAGREAAAEIDHGEV